MKPISLTITSHSLNANDHSLIHNGIISIVSASLVLLKIHKKLQLYHVGELVFHFKFGVKPKVTYISIILDTLMDFCLLL